MAGDNSPRPCAAGEFLAARVALTDHEKRQPSEARRRDGEANRLNELAWKAVRFAPVSKADAREAVANVRQAVELAPDNGFFLNTLGVSLYRAGEFEEALTTLTRSAALNAASPDGEQAGDWAFLAMTHHQLGHTDEAKQALQKFRAVAAATGTALANEETQAWLEEATALIEPKDGE